jgi:hypothetical protein
MQFVAAGMGPDKAKSIFALGCVDCSKTLRVVDAEDVATWMNKQMSTATPPAPETPADALAARPLLEKVAQMGDTLLTGGELTEVWQVTKQAAAWLRSNPPGQPVAIEPRGCPTPGACSCVEPTPPAPEVGEGMEAGESVTHDLKVWSSYFESLLDGTKNFEVRFNDRGFKSGHYLRLREWLNNEFTGRELTKRVTYVLQGGLFGLEAGYVALALAVKQSELAALVQHLAEPATALVVPVNEQPWNRPGWCDAEGRCWFCNSYSMGRWNYETPPDPAQDWGRLGTVTHSAPHWAIPRPGRMPELPSLSVYSYDAGESVRISRMGESNCWCIIASGLIPDWWFNLEMHYDFASAGAALAAIRLAQQTAKKSEET